MYLVDACVGCGSPRLERLPAVLAPFIRSYVLGRKPATATRDDEVVSLCLCLSCDLAFYDRRFTDDEIDQLYSGYRGEGYFHARNRVEPFYTRSVNTAIGADQTTISLRRRKVGDFLRVATAARPPLSVLDYGGDAGQFIPDWSGLRKYVYEISDVTPCPGIERLGDLADLREPVDLVMLAHVLEHASDPLAMLRHLRGLATRQGWLYVEVPLDRPQAPPPRLMPLHRRWVSLVSGSPRRAILADVVSTPLRVLVRQRWTPFTFPKLHEHLNHFSEASLAASVEAAGWQPLTSMTYTMGRGPLKVAVLGMLSRLGEMPAGTEPLAEPATEDPRSRGSQ
jgi:hypothetical protein